MGSSMVRALVVADTHLSDATLHRMPTEVWELADRADVVLHAGDASDGSVLDALGEHAPVHAVLGNNDRTLDGRLPIELRIELGGVVVGMVHDSGPTTGRSRRLRQRFPEADVVIFGHSHQPVNEESTDGLLLLNPGSPTHRRRQPVHTVGWLELGEGLVSESMIIEVGPLAASATSVAGG